MASSPSEFFNFLLGELDSKFPGLLHQHHSPDKSREIVKDLVNFERTFRQNILTQIQKHIEGCGVSPGFIDSVYASASQDILGSRVETPSRILEQSSETGVEQTFGFGEPLPLEISWNSEHTRFSNHEHQNRVAKKKRIVNHELLSENQRLLQNCLVQHCEKQHLVHVPFLLDLFEAIASPKSLIELHSALQNIRGGIRAQLPMHSATLAEAMNALDAQDNSAAASSLLRRFTLLHVNKLRDERAGSGSSTSDISQVIDLIVEEGYPSVKRGSAAFSTKRKAVQNQLALSKTWVDFQQMFPRGLIALVPATTVSGVQTRRVEKIPHHMISLFIQILSTVRGVFLHKIGRQISESIDAILTRGQTQVTFEFEKVDSRTLSKVEADSDTLIELCKSTSS